MYSTATSKTRKGSDQRCWNYFMVLAALLDLRKKGQYKVTNDHLRQHLLLQELSSRRY